MRRRCPHFYGVSQASARWLSHFGATAEGVLYNAVDSEALSAIAQSPPCNFRARFGIPPATPLVVFSGRFIPGKGALELIAAFALLRGEWPGAVLLMAGDGPLFDRARQLAGPGVHLAGALAYEENIALLAQADVYCLPTKTEGFPTTVLEAAALGTCIVTTAAGGIPELVTDGKTGLLMPDTHPAAIAAALRRALANPAARAAMGKAAKAIVDERFTWRATAGHLLEIAQKDRNT
jgi:glycosyltransferase involved in cell wall biosynthesis